VKKVINLNINFEQGLGRLGFHKNDNALFLLAGNEKKQFIEPQINFHIEKADEFDASAVYLRKQLNGSFKPQAYLYDFTNKDFNDQEQDKLVHIQKNIWSSGEAPLACIFYKTEIKILNCTTHIINDYTPVHLVKHLKITGDAHHLYNEQFAIKIKSGIFWEEEELNNKFKFQNSAYDKLIDNIRYIIDYLKMTYKGVTSDLINKLIVQSILIKYLEERIDNDGNKLLSNKYFKKYEKAETFNDVLKRKGKFIDLLDDLNDPNKGFNGNVFEWKKDEKNVLKNLDLSILANLLDTDKLSLQSTQIDIKFPNWRYFEFKFIPVELISRLYEEFLGEDKKDKGLFYTPSHLAKLLIDESLPLKNYKNINLSNYKVLDPACGSGIFLVTAFKRLVQIWRLQNNMRPPDLSVLKSILLNIYGIDKEKQAVRLSSFSLCLALCNELNPVDIITKLKFDDLRDRNLINSDFFECNKFKNEKFDLIIGNPPFNRGAIKQYSPYWEINDTKVNIPQGQIALKFLSESLQYLKEKGLQCLIIKSSGLLYNSSSEAYKRILFSNFNVIQLLDFTALARNKSLWDNGADVASAAIFIKNEQPNFKSNILHLTFRRTKATKERIVFEIDDYDLHFVNRQSAIENNFIWKSNLLGGGRVKELIDRFQCMDSLDTYLSQNNCEAGEGYIIGTNGKPGPKYIYDLPTLPTEAITEEGIHYSELKKMNEETTYVKVSQEVIFKAPNIIIWENMGEEKLPVFYNKKSFSFKDKLIGIGSHSENKDALKVIFDSFEEYSDFYRFYIFATSSQVLINLNTAVLKNDFMQLPFLYGANKPSFSEVEKKVISDVNLYMQDFIRHGEHSKALKAIPVNEILPVVSTYGEEFSDVLNLIYETGNRKFRLSDIVTFNKTFIATIFKYDSESKKPKFHSDISNLNLDGLTDLEISKQLSVNRIIKLYPQKDTIVFIKPNQYRYWISLTAYRDADKCFSDLSNAGY
jgi:methylase of polypeptide subunit release factors